MSDCSANCGIYRNKSVRLAVSSTVNSSGHYAAAGARVALSAVPMYAGAAIYNRANNSPSSRSQHCRSLRYDNGNKANLAKHHYVIRQHGYGTFPLEVLSPRNPPFQSLSKAGMVHSVSG